MFIQWTHSEIRLFCNTLSWILFVDTCSCCFIWRPMDVDFIYYSTSWSFLVIVCDEQDSALKRLHGCTQGCMPPGGLRLLLSDMNGPQRNATYLLKPQRHIYELILILNITNPDYLCFHSMLHTNLVFLF